MNTPPGFRAKQTVDMLNSDWPIGPVGVRTLAAPDKVDTVRDTMENLWWERPFTLSGVDYYAGLVTLHLVNSFGAGQDIEIHTDENGMVDRFDAELQQPKINSWVDVDTELAKSDARYSYQVAKVDDGRCDRVAGTNTGQSLPLASIFKLYVLLAVADAVKAGKLSWDDQLTITLQAKAVGSSGLEKLPPGTQVSVRTAAEKMIANSDNMATDLLIEKVGTAAVERALVEAGHHDPESMTHSRLCTSCFRSAGVSRICGSSGATRLRPGYRRPARSCWRRRIPVPTSQIRHAPTLRHRRTARNGTAAPKTFAGCTLRCSRALSG